MKHSRSINPTKIKSLLKASVAGMLLASATAEASSTSDTIPPDQPKYWEQCYGVVSAGKNDCSSLDGRHGCHGAATVDRDPTEWMWVPRGVCTRLNGGQLVSAKKVKAKAQSCTSKS